MTITELANIKNMSKMELTFAMKAKANQITAELALNDGFINNYIEGLQTEYRLLKKQLETG